MADNSVQYVLCLIGDMQLWQAITYRSARVILNVMAVIADLLTYLLPHAHAESTNLLEYTGLPYL